MFKRVTVLLLLMLAGVTARAGFERTQPMPTSASQLDGDTVYTLESGRTNIIDVSSSWQAAALWMPPEVTTSVVWIAEGAKLTIKGGCSPTNDTAEANGQAAGRPALWMLNPNSVLIIAGKGELDATGGDGGHGGNSGNATSAVATMMLLGLDDFVCGQGGTGGYGGGAAAVAIGGGSGNGANGVEAEPMTMLSARIDPYPWPNEDSTVYGNQPGREGLKGGPGGDCGTIYVLGKVKVTARRGNPGKPGETPGSGGLGAWYSMTDDIFFGGGGSGGCGGGGPAATVDIGGGAGGAGGGGSGASGSVVISDDYDKDKWYSNITRPEQWMLGGGEGYGGRSDVLARKGKDGDFGGHLDWVREYWNGLTINKDDDDKEGQHRTRTACKGGPGGTKGVDGKHGHVYQMNGTTINGETGANALNRFSEASARNSDFAGFPEGVIYKLTYHITTTDRQEYKVLLGGTYPAPDVPARAHYSFKGFYTERNGKGEKYFDEHCQWARGADSNFWDNFQDSELYAYWELEKGLPRGEARIIDDGETLCIDELSGSAAYYQPENAPLFDIRTGGRLELRNLSFFGDVNCEAGLIRSSGELLVSNCVFYGCSAANGRGGAYHDLPGAETLFVNCTFSECAALEGGAIAAAGSKVTVLSSTFVDCFCTIEAPGQPGGAVVMSEKRAHVNMVGCTIADNYALYPADCRAVSAHYGVDQDHQAEIGYLNNIFRTKYGCSLITNSEASVQWTCNLFTADSVNTDDPGYRYLGTVQEGAQRDIGGVNHRYFHPYGTLRTDGCAQFIFPAGSWPFFSYDTNPPQGAVPLHDQFNQYPNDGYCGSRTGNTLQRLIDLAAEGDTINVPEGAYDPVIVAKRVTLVGGNRNATAVDGEALEPCVTYYPGGEDTVWVNFTFRNGCNLLGDGGGWTTASAGVPSGIASNCVFWLCSANNGGGVANAAVIADSVFYECVARLNGGGTYNCQLVDRTRYQENIAGGDGGGSANDVMVRCSLLERNSAENGGGGADNSNFYLCTFAKNSAKDVQYSEACGAALVGCVIYGSQLSDDYTPAPQFTRSLIGDQFVNAAGGDYHLALRDGNGNKLYHDDIRVTTSALLNQVKNENWLDFERLPCVAFHPLDGDAYLYAGCYAFAPFKMSGLKVTATDRDMYEDSNAKTTLREAIAAAAEYSAKTNGDLTVTFDDELFAYDDTIAVNFGLPQIDLRVFTNTTLVVRGPTNKVVVLDGRGTNRFFRVFADNHARFENLVFQRGFGSTFGEAPQPGSDGGAVLNSGHAMFSNCVFRANTAGTGTQDPAREHFVGNGGAIATCAGGTSTVYAATFAGNRASKGGALWTADGGASHVFYSTLVGNIADGAVATDSAGGAAAQERKSYGAKGSDLWLVNCLVANNRVVGAADAGGAILGAKKGLILLNSVVVGNYAANVTNDIAMPPGSFSDFVYTAYGTRTPAVTTGYEPSRIIYSDVNSIGGVAYKDAIGITNDMPVITLAMPQMVVPLANTLSAEATYPWTSDDFGAIGYGSESELTSALAGSRVSALVKRGSPRTMNLLGVSQDASGAMMLGPVAITGDPERGDSGGGGGGGGTTPEYDDEDQVAEDIGVVSVQRIDGSKAWYESVEDAKKHYRPGDTVAIKDPADDVLSDELVDTFDTYLRKFVDSHDWFTLTVDKPVYSSYSLALNDSALPVIHSDTDLATSDDKVFVVLEHSSIKPGLWYSLGYSDSVGGPYVCDKWVEANEDGYLKESLTAPKLGGAGFYRVMVAPYVK